MTAFVVECKKALLDTRARLAERSTGRQAEELRAVIPRLEQLLADLESDETDTSA